MNIPEYNQRQHYTKQQRMLCDAMNVTLQHVVDSKAPATVKEAALYVCEYAAERAEIFFDEPDADDRADELYEARRDRE